MNGILKKQNKLPVNDVNSMIEGFLTTFEGMCYRDKPVDQMLPTTLKFRVVLTSYVICGDNEFGIAHQDVIENITPVNLGTIIIRINIWKL